MTNCHLVMWAFRDKATSSNISMALASSYAVKHGPKTKRVCWAEVVDDEPFHTWQWILRPLLIFCLPQRTMTTINWIQAIHNKEEQHGMNIIISDGSYEVPLGVLQRNAAGNYSRCNILNWITVKNPWLILSVLSLGSSSGSRMVLDSWYDHSKFCREQSFHDLIEMSRFKEIFLPI